MIVRWRGDVALGDRSVVAALYGVSDRSVRRYCTPIDYDGETRRALYDIVAAEEHLDAVLPRPARTAAARRARLAQLAQRPGGVR